MCLILLSIIIVFQFNFIGLFILAIFSMKKQSILLILFLLVALTALYVFFVTRKEGMRGGSMYSKMQKSFENVSNKMKTNKKTKNRLEGRNSST